MSFTVKKESQSVDVRPVDSVGGAKPEAEERPFETKSEIDGQTVRDALTGAGTVKPKSMTIVQAEPVADASVKIGKSCALCKHYGREAGVELMSDVRALAAKGDPVATQFIRNFKAYVIGEHGSMLQPEIYGSPYAPDSVDTYISEMGLCKAYSAEMNDMHFVHPTEACPSEDERRGMGWVKAGCPDVAGLKELPEPIPMLFEPKDSGVDQLVEKMRDTLLMTAAGKVK